MGVYGLRVVVAMFECDKKHFAYSTNVQMQAQSTVSMWSRLRLVRNQYNPQVMYY